MSKDTSFESYCPAHTHTHRHTPDCVLYLDQKIWSLKAKFHYAILSILVADRSEAGRRPASSLLAS